MDSSGVSKLEPTKRDITSGGYITVKELAKHNLAQDAWVVINGKVYE